jgi:hypothetical protein
VVHVHLHDDTLSGAAYTAPVASIVERCVAYQVMPAMIRLGGTLRASAKPAMVESSQYPQTSGCRFHKEGRQLSSLAMDKKAYFSE